VSRVALRLFALATAAMGLTACGTALAPGGKGQTDIVGALTTIASDPRCGHTDRISGNLGGLAGNNLNVFLERTCPPRVVPLKDVTGADLDPPT
jgi:hypothetical protein